MALRSAEVFQGSASIQRVKTQESTRVQPTADRLDTPPTLPSLGHPSAWEVENAEERDLREVEWGIARYLQEGGQITSGDVHVGNAAFWQAVNLAEVSGETLAPDEIHSYIMKRSAATEGPNKSDRAIFEEVISEREVSQPVLVFESAA